MLKIKQLVKSYGSLEVLQGINLEIKKGEVVAVLGPSGCGKSTLLRTINGLESINSGEIYFKDELISKKNIIAMRQKIGMVFQSYDLFAHLNVLQNIMLAPLKVQKRDEKEVKEFALRLLERVRLLEKQSAYPRELSGGQKQRIAIVRALCMRPELMLFDEVTAALDPEMVREVLEVVRDLANDGMTMLIVTHEMNFARAVASRVVFLDGGRVTEDESSEQFFSSPKHERAREFLKSFEY